MNILKTDKCCNCGACINTCPGNAISIDDSGCFYKVKVDDEKCTDCNLCLKVCPLNDNNGDVSIQRTLNAYAAVNRDKKIIMSSSSGGAFPALADMILKNGGIVFGAVFSDDNRKVLISNSDSCEINNMQGSKYVESLTNSTFKQVKYYLKKGRQVLYAAAPCQIAGLYKYLGKRPDNLLTCDFTCGGFASHKIFEDWQNLLENKYKSKICSINFRPKIFGWNEHAVTVKFSNSKKYIKQAKLDPYFAPYVYHHYTVRDYCLECRFSDNHYSDIIMADFWCVNKFKEIPNDDTGISLLISNSATGDAILKQLNKKMEMYTLPLDEASYNLKSTENSYEHLEKRKNFLSCYAEHGLLTAYSEFCHVNLKKQAEIKLRDILRKNRMKKK